MQSTELIIKTVMILCCFTSACNVRSHREKVFSQNYLNLHYENLTTVLGLKLLVIYLDSVKFFGMLVDSIKATIPEKYHNYYI